jgi:hypothetical protein
MRISFKIFNHNILRLLGRMQLNSLLKTIALIIIITGMIMNSWKMSIIGVIIMTF